MNLVLKIKQAGLLGGLTLGLKKVGRLNMIYSRLFYVVMKWVSSTGRIHTRMTGFSLKF